MLVPVFTKIVYERKSCGCCEREVKLELSTKEFLEDFIDNRISTSTGQLELVTNKVNFLIEAVLEIVSKDPIKYIEYLETLACRHDFNVEYEDES